MAYDEDLAGRVRNAIPSDNDVTERKISPVRGDRLRVDQHHFANTISNPVRRALAVTAPGPATGPGRGAASSRAGSAPTGVLHHVHGQGEFTRHA